MDSSSIGKWINNNSYTIVGVVRDFHSSDLRLGIKPLILLPHSRINGFYFSIKILNGAKLTALDFINKKFVEILPGEYQELITYKALMKNIFVSFENVIKVLTYLSILSIFIASVGLYALAAFSVKQRTKEVGIRKVVGASVLRILFILKKEFIRLVIYAILIAWPISYFLWNKLLQNFVNRIDIDIWIFLISGVIVLSVATVSVAYQTLKASFANPVDSLKHE